MEVFKSFLLVEDLISISKTHSGDGGKSDTEKEKKVEGVIIETYRTLRGAMSQQKETLKE